MNYKPSGGGGGPSFQMNIPFTKSVKTLVIANVVVWFFLQVILEQFFLSEPFVTQYFSLIPGKVIEFFVWQPITYMFLHDVGPTHILFNMLILWMLGSELEGHWGSRFFTVYYFVCGIGAALIYILVSTVYGLSSGNMQALYTPVLGASGAIFGLMLAYGIIFGERVVYFMFVFPMKARFFIMILGAVELVMILNNGIVGGKVANLAHLGGIISGFLFLTFWTRWSRGQKQRQTSKAGRKLRLVVDNNNEAPKGPKYWN